MPYIIRNESTDRYMVYNMNGGLNISWTSSRESASAFLTLGSAQNFVLHNYKPYAKKKSQPEDNVKVIELFPMDQKTPVPLSPDPMTLDTKAQADACLKSMPSPGWLAPLRAMWAMMRAGS